MEVQKGMCSGDMRRNGSIAGALENIKFSVSSIRTLSSLEDNSGVSQRCISYKLYVVGRF